MCFKELVEETTHHPAEAARYAADMVNAGNISILNAAIRLYRDDWFMYAEYGVRFPHFYQMVCALVK